MRIARTHEERAGLWILSDELSENTLTFPKVGSAIGDSRVRGTSSVGERKFDLKSG
jgi:hypothetical protein